MTVFTLSLKADLTNVASISVPSDHTFCLKVKESSGDEQRDKVRVTAAKEYDIPGSRGTAHFLLKWFKDARHSATLSIVEVKGVTQPYTAAKAGQWVPLAAFECRGMEPNAWYPEDGFLVQTSSGQKFEDVDLSEGEWTEYDEKLGDSVEIMELQWRFAVHKP